VRIPLDYTTLKYTMHYRLHLTESECVFDGWVGT